VTSPHDAVENHPLGTQAAPVCEGGVFAHQGADHRWLLTRSRAGRRPAADDGTRNHAADPSSQLKCRRQCGNAL